ncbi:lysozyme [Kribbella sp. NPDC048915]|uniref:lysozyme n=1 Tax=Kribbella sp. NPDC048915 TaxID=3155148 RepID=UPI0033C8459B
MKSALFTGAAVALGLILATTGSAHASTTPESQPTLQPTAQARQHGIDKAGDAYLGWTQNSTTASAPAGNAPAATVEGMDVSSHQGNVNWSYWWGQGKRFAYVKATEGTSYKNPYFAQQYNGSYNIGMIRGAYHFGLPNSSSGATQANYFATNGGGWSKDGKTLPGVLDIEYNPYGATCYGLSASAMVSWIRDFVNTYKARTGRDAVIYTNYDWWSRCTGNSTAFNSTNPLWVARYSSSPGTLPGGWPFYTFWQYTSSPLDQNRFNGAYDRLQALANG